MNTYTLRTFCLLMVLNGSMCVVHLSTTRHSYSNGRSPFYFRRQERRRAARELKNVLLNESVASKTYKLEKLLFIIWQLVKMKTILSSILKLLLLLIRLLMKMFSILQMQFINVEASVEDLRRKQTNLNLLGIRLLIK